MKWKEIALRSSATASGTVTYAPVRLHLATVVGEAFHVTRRMMAARARTTADQCQHPSPDHGRPLWIGRDVAFGATAVSGEREWRGRGTWGGDTPVSRLFCASSGPRRESFGLPAAVRRAANGRGGGRLFGRDPAVFHSARLHSIAMPGVIAQPARRQRFRRRGAFARGVWPATTSGGQTGGGDSGSLRIGRPVPRDGEPTPGRNC